MGELKPCPFCGCEAHVEEHVVGGRIMYAIACCNYFCEIAKQRAFGTEQEAIAAWNQRYERTCKIEVLESPFGGKYRGCSECHEPIHVYDFNLYGRFCHNCGAKVVE